MTLKKSRATLKLKKSINALYHVSLNLDSHCEILCIVSPEHMPKIESVGKPHSVCFNQLHQRLQFYPIPDKNYILRILGNVVIEQ